MALFKKTISVKDATVTSTWETDPRNPKSFKNGGPTVSTSEPQNIDLNVPAGAENVEATLTADVSSPNTGASFLGINGNPLKKDNNATKSSSEKITKTKVPLKKNSNTAEIQYEFKANGSTTGGDGSSTVSITNAKLEVTFEINPKPATQKSEPLLSVPPQSCCIYCEGQIYMFDGVIRIQHNISTKIEEEPNAEKYSYVNNALNEPDKLTLDVMMSDVYTGGGPMVSQPAHKAEQSTVLSVAAGNGITTENSRSANAYGILKQMKEDRKYVAVVTPQFVYCDMLITSIVANQDESCPYGWSGQVVFQSRHAKVNEGYGKKAANTGSAEPTPSFVSQLGNNKTPGVTGTPKAGGIWAGIIETAGKGVSVLKGG